MIIDIRYLEENSECINCEYVLDLNYESEIIGVEFIDYYDFLCGASISKIKEVFEGKNFNHISLDSDIGAIYLKIKNDKPCDQKAVKGTICKSSSGEISFLSIDEPSA